MTGSFRTYGYTDIHTYRGPKQGKPSRNWNSSPGSVLASIHYRFVKQYWLVNITSLYRVQVSKKYRFLPQIFNSPSVCGQFTVFKYPLSPKKPFPWVKEFFFNFIWWVRAIWWRKTEKTKIHKKRECEKWKAYHIGGFANCAFCS